MPKGGRQLSGFQKEEAAEKENQNGMNFIPSFEKATGREAKVDSISSKVSEGSCTIKV